METTDKLFEKIVGGLSEEKKKLDLEKSKLQRLVSALEDFTNKKTDMNLKMGNLSGKISACIAEGKSTEKLMQQQRDLKLDSDQISDLIGQLEKSIPEQMASLKKVQEELRIKLQELVRESRVDAKNLFEKKIEEATDLQVSWSRMLGRIRATLGFGVSENPFEVLDFSNLAGAKSALWVLEKMARGE